MIREDRRKKVLWVWGEKGEVGCGWVREANVNLSSGHCLRAWGVAPLEANVNSASRACWRVAGRRMLICTGCPV